MFQIMLDQPLLATPYTRTVQTGSSGVCWVRLVHTRYTQGTHKVHTRYTQGTHKVHTRYTQGTHKVHTRYTQGIMWPCVSEVGRSWTGHSHLALPQRSKKSSLAALLCTKCQAWGLSQTHTRARRYTHAQVCWVCTVPLHTHTLTLAHTHAQIHIYTCTCTNTHACMHACRIEDGPVATIRLPHALPYGLHGAWTPDYWGRHAFQNIVWLLICASLPPSLWLLSFHCELFAHLCTLRNSESTSQPFCAVAF